MTVRVIKAAIKHVSCQHCGSELEYTPKDVQQGVQSQFDGPDFTVSFIECPECRKHVKVPPSTGAR
jgi:uncharacterized protein with PIN domain